MSRLLLLGFAKTLEQPDIGLCHNATDIFCPGATRKRYGHAAVHGSERGSIRKQGVAVIWGDDSRATRSLVNACPDPIVLVLCATAPKPGGFLDEALDDVLDSGRVCRLIFLTDSQPLVIVNAGLGKMESLHGTVMGHQPQPPLPATELSDDIVPEPIPTPAPASDYATPVPYSPVVTSAVAETPVDAPE